MSGVKKYTCEVCDFNDQAIKVDWDKIPRANVDLYKWTDLYKPETFARAVFVKDYGFVVRLTSMEANPVANMTEDGSSVHLDSCLEFFAQFGKEGFLNFEANANAVKKIKFGPDRKGRKVIHELYPELFQVMTERTVDSWSLLIFLSIEDLLVLYPSLSRDDFKSGFEFAGNFYHMGTDPNNLVEDPAADECYYGMWNEVLSETPNFYHPECFGKIIVK